ncbi:MAG: hypothetical protein JKY82_04175 [Rhizobiaceae bacterium]|nr:hypothetical protein [Rhizobiaceae bacterium]MBL4731781.1 hypothetical protein [Rhizobiaceae bacterium]
MRFAIILFSIFFSLSMVSSSNAGAASRTYLVNGIASAVPFIGYGMRNLKKKIRGAKLFSYLTSGEGKAVARSIVKDAAARYANDPDIKINLIGISYGANMVTQIASSLAAKGVNVNYLGIIEGGKMSALRSNVQKADNFTCTNSDCTAGKVYVAGGNSVTVLKTFSIKSSHIPLANNAQVHSRVVAQIR